MRNKYRMIAAMALFLICVYASLKPLAQPIKQSFPSDPKLLGINSIQELIDRAKDGDVVSVPSGTYIENLKVNKPIKLIAEGVVNIRPLNPNEDVVEILSGGVALHGFSIIGPVATLKSGIYIENASGCYVHSNNVYNCSFGIYVKDTKNFSLLDITVVGSDFGVYLCKVEDGAVTRNNMFFDKYGLALSECTNITVEKNFLMNDVVGIYLYLSHSSQVLENVVNHTERAISIISSYNNKISMNTISNSSYGVSVDASSDNEIDENIFTGNAMGVYVFDSGYNVISNNSITYGDNNVYVEKSRNLLISNNVLRLSKNNLVLDFSQNVTVAQNLLESAEGNGFTSFRSEGCKLVANLVRLNRIGISLDSSANFTVERNLIESNEYGLYLHQSSKNLIYRNRCIDSPVASFYSDGLGENNLVRKLEVNSCRVLINLTFSYYGDIAINELESIQDIGDRMIFLDVCFNLTLLAPRSWVLVNVTFSPSSLIGGERISSNLYLWTGSGWEPATESAIVTTNENYISVRLKKSGVYAMLLELPRQEEPLIKNLFLLISLLFATLSLLAFTVLRKRTPNLRLTI